MHDTNLEWNMSRMVSLNFYYFFSIKKKNVYITQFFFVFTASVKAVQDLECIFIILLTQQLLEWLRMCIIDLV